MIKCLLLGTHLAFSGATLVHVPDNYKYESCDQCEVAKVEISKMSAWHWQCRPVEETKKEGVRV